MKMITKLLCSTNVALALAYENGPGWKMDGDKLAIDGNGDPIYIDSAGKEQSIKHDSISQRNREAQTNRERAEKAEGDLAKYRDKSGKLIDPEAAVKAIETVSKIDAKKLIDAGEVDTLREQMRGEFTTQLGEKDKAIGELQTRVDNMTIDGIFKGSDFLANNVAVPRDMVEASLRNHFAVKDGKIVVTDKDGNPLMSKKSAGDYADPQEAIELLIDRHPQKDMILKAPDASGSGNQGGGGNRGQGNTMKRSAFDALDQGQRAQMTDKIAKGEVTIVD